MTEKFIVFLFFRKKILQHIENCNQELRSHIEAIAPPSYEEAMSTSGSSVSYTTQSSVDGTVTSNEFSYSELGSVLENLKADMGGQSAQLIYNCDDTLLYFISSSGIVTVSSGPETVRIFEIEGNLTSAACNGNKFVRNYSPLNSVLFSA